MADLVHNIAKGRVVEYFNRVDTNDPTNAALIVIAWNAADTDDAIRDADTVAAIEALGSTAEVTNTNYARKTLTDADITMPSPDDTNNRYDLDIADQVWGPPGPSAGTAWTDLGIAYDSDTTGGTDANIVPLTWHDFAVTPDGNTITAQIDSAGFFRAA